MKTGLMPAAIKRIIPPGANDPAIIPCGVILHVAVSTSDSLHDYFDGPSGGVESHFYVRFDGTIEQYRSIYREADAQFAGNSFGTPRRGFVSVETEGMGTGRWTDAQLAAIKRIILWVHSQEPFAMRVCPAWNAAGVGFHSLFKEWNTDAHSCPGPNRIRQFHAVIEPWLGTALRGPKDSRGKRIDEAIHDLWLEHAKQAKAGHEVRAKRIHQARKLLKSINPFTWKS